MRRRFISVVGVAAASVVIAPALAFGAGGGYGPSAAIPGGVPGGFTSVRSAHIFSLAGGKLRVRDGQALITVIAPRGSLVAGTQVAITGARVAGLRAGLGAFSHYRVLAAAGVVLDHRGAPRTSRHPITVTVNDPQLRPGDLIVVFRGGHFRVAGRVSQIDTVSFDVRGVTEFAVLGA